MFPPPVDVKSKALPGKKPSLLLASIHNSLRACNIKFKSCAISRFQRGYKEISVHTCEIHSMRRYIVFVHSNAYCFERIFNTHQGSIMSELKQPILEIYNVNLFCENY